MSEVPSSHARGKRRPDRAALVIGPALLIVAAVIWWDAGRLAEMSNYSRIGPATVPHVVAIGLALLAVWIHRYYEIIWVPLSVAIPAVIGGLVSGTWDGAWLGFLWGGLARIFMVHHITWSVNSICHTFGSVDYKVNDHSRNNLFVALASFGEGWHNNHHAFPSSARQGLKWWQFDVSWYIIRTMQFLGLAWNVQTPSDRAKANRGLH